VLLSLPPGADPDEDHDDLVETLTDAVDAAGLGEVDGTLRGPDTLEVYLYGPDAAGLADLVAQVVRSHRVAAGATLTLRRGAPGTPTETQPLG
jgi:hypothetical protein